MKNLSKNSRYFLMIVVVGIFIMLILGFNNRIANLRRLEAEAGEVGQVVAQLTATYAAIDAQLTYAASDDPVEKWAYEEARMVRDGDHPIAPIAPRENTPEPDPIQPVAPKTVENWEFWKALFFGENSP